MRHECTVKYFESCITTQITKVQINDLLLYKNVQAENVVLSRPFLGCGSLIVHTCKGCNENEYMSIGWRQQFPH